MEKKLILIVDRREWSPIVVEGAPISVIQTTWPKIRIALYERPNGRFEFYEQFLRSEGWVTNQGFGEYGTQEEAAEKMKIFAEEYEET